MLFWAGIYFVEKTACVYFPAQNKDSCFLVGKFWLKSSLIYLKFPTNCVIFDFLGGKTKKTSFFLKNGLAIGAPAEQPTATERGR